MNALVTGYGSIGRRHVRLLNELGCNTAAVSRREVDYAPSYARIEDGLAAYNPEYVVIANATGEHQATLAKLSRLGYAGTVLVEKPLFHRSLEIPPNNFRHIYVAYNLRFHPLIQRLKSLLAGEKIISTMAYVGQYLPQWRPNRNYRELYSAKKEEGGGVLRDLSHELDYLTWLLGGWVRVTALGGHLSPLEITSDDVAVISLVTPRCPAVALQLNYLDRLTRRFILINTARHTIEVDLARGLLTVDRAVEHCAVEADMTYREMHKSVMNGGCATLCSCAEGLEVLRIIEAAELSIEQKKWIEK